MTLYKLLLITLLSGLAVAIAEIDVETILAQHKQSLKTLLNTPDQRHSQQGQEECFNWYFDALDRDMDIYRHNTKVCDTNFYNDIRWHNVDGYETRLDFENRTSGVCNNFYRCEKYYSDLLDFYYCYSQVSTESTSIIYRLSADSTAEYNSLSIKYNNVASNKKKCDKNAREDYIERSKVTDKQFEDCRDGYGTPTTLRPTSSQSPSESEIYSTTAPLTDEPTEEPTTDW